MPMNSFQRNLENVIEAFSPEWAMKRQLARNLISQTRKYDAGGYGKQFDYTDRNVRAPYQETEGSLSKLRGFARTLEANTPEIAKSIQVIANNVVGTGIRPAFTQIKSDGKRPKNPPPAVRSAKQLWLDWGVNSTECDFYGMNTIYGLQDQICAAIARDGEVLVMKTFDDNYKTIPLRLQILEVDHLDETKTMPIGNDGGFIIQGVEFNSRGKRVAYWILDERPSDVLYNTGATPRRVLADKVMHLFRVERPGQVRGIPAGVQAFIKIKDITEYERAELIRQKIAAMFTAFITTSDGAPRSPDEYLKASRMEAGMIEYMPPGDTVTFGNPPRSDGYAAYVRTQVMKIAMAYGVTYESISQDLSNVNFSSARIGKIEANANFDKWQQFVLIPQFCNTTWQWVKEASAFVPTLNIDNATVTWTPPRRPLTDPLKEIQAMKEALAAKLISHQEAARELGWEYSDLQNELHEDLEFWDELGERPDYMVENIDPDDEADKALTQAKASKPATTTNKTKK